MRARASGHEGDLDRAVRPLVTSRERLGRLIERESVADHGVGDRGVRAEDTCGHVEVALLADARACHALSTDATTAAYETALHGLIEVLRARGEQGANGSTDALGNCEADDAFDMDPDVRALVAYLEDRMCVPRDWGAPVAAVIRGLHVRHGDAAAPDETRRVVRVNNF